MANIIISYHADVSCHDSLQHLFRFVSKANDKKHCILGIFLYQDAVFNASNAISLPSDELQVARIWQSLSDMGITLSMCVTAAERRGLNINASSFFTVSGLAEFAMSATEADKWVQFK